MGRCNYTMRTEKLVESRYSVRVAAGNIVGTGKQLACQGQIGKIHSNHDNQYFSHTETDNTN